MLNEKPAAAPYFLVQQKDLSQRKQDLLVAGTQL